MKIVLQDILVAFLFPSFVLEEPKDLFPELAELFVMPVMYHLLLNDKPEPFYHVEVRAVGRQEHELRPFLPFQERPDHLGAVVAGVVGYKIGLSVFLFPQYPFQVGDHRLGVDPRYKIRQCQRNGATPIDQMRNDPINCTPKSRVSNWKGYILKLKNDNR